MPEISRNKIPREVLELILEQNRKGVPHKQIARNVNVKFKDTYKITVDQKEIGKLIMAATNGLDDESSQYKVE